VIGVYAHFMDTTGGCILERSRKSSISIVNCVLDEGGILKSYDF
jgi:hypothetical protein